MGNISDNLIFMLMMMLAFKKIHIMLRCVYCNSIYVMKRCCISQYISIISNILREYKAKVSPSLFTIMLLTRVSRGRWSQQLENSLAVEWNFIIVSSVSTLQLMLSASLLLIADLLAPCSSCVHIDLSRLVAFANKYDFHAFDYDYSLLVCRNFRKIILLL